MKTFTEFVNLFEAPMPGGPGGGLGSPGGLPPGGPSGGLGGGPPLGGLGGGPMPPMGGGPSLGGLGGPGPGSGGQQPQQQAFKIESPDVWKILNKLLKGEDSEKQEKPLQK